MNISHGRKLIRQLVSLIPEIVGMLNLSGFNLKDLFVQLADPLSVFIDGIYLLFDIQVQVILIFTQTVIYCRSPGQEFAASLNKKSLVYRV